MNKSQNPVTYMFCLCFFPVFPTGARVYVSTLLGLNSGFRKTESVVSFGRQMAAERSAEGAHTRKKPLG